MTVDLLLFFVLFNLNLLFRFVFENLHSLLFQMTLDQSQNQSNLDDSLSTTTTTMTQSITHKHAHGAIVRIHLENFM